MFLLVRIVALCAIACAPACTSSQSPIALAPVGPRQLPPESESEPKGSLVVYSAFEPMNASVDSEERRHSDYELCSADGRLIRRVANTAPRFSEEPAVVRLAPGSYSITARANGSLRVKVPVVIVADKTTCVRLDGSEPLGRDRVAASEFVTLPDGRAVGWRVKTSD
jgi:hypothetical protein